MPAGVSASHSVQGVQYPATVLLRRYLVCLKFTFMPLRSGSLLVYFRYFPFFPFFCCSLFFLTDHTHTLYPTTRSTTTTSSCSKSFTLLDLSASSITKHSGRVCARWPAFSMVLAARRYSQAHTHTVTCAMDIECVAGCATSLLTRRPLLQISLIPDHTLVRKHNFIPDLGLFSN